MSSKKHGQSPESHYNLRGNVQGYEKMLKEENELLKAKVEEQNKTIRQLKKEKKLQRCCTCGWEEENAAVFCYDCA